MFKRNVSGAIVVVLAFAASGAGIQAAGHERTLVVTMTNDPNANQIRVYDAESHILLQTLSTHGKGGVGGNARGLKQHDGTLVAVVNNGSNNVALFRRDGDVLKFDKLVSTTSAPVSVDLATTICTSPVRRRSTRSCFIRTQCSGWMARRLSSWRVAGCPRRAAQARSA